MLQVLESREDVFSSLPKQKSLDDVNGPVHNKGQAKTAG